MEILRYTAFSGDADGGNPAGVVLDATGADAATMLQVAAQVGYSETAFLSPLAEPGDYDVRYFSPQAEVPFCGHATIATGVAHAERFGPGTLRLHTRAGTVEVTSTGSAETGFRATLTSVGTRTEPLDDATEARLLAALRWSPRDLDPRLPRLVAYAGAWHPIIAAATPERLADLDYDFDSLAALMAERDWTTIALVWRESPTVLHARNPFPPGGVVEDPATGAAAAALGGYLRDVGLLPPGGDFVVHQGHDLGRPSRLDVHVPDEPGAGVSVTGAACRLPDPATAAG